MTARLVYKSLRNDSQWQPTVVSNDSVTHYNGLQVYASAVLDDTKNKRRLLWGWVLNQVRQKASQER